jgi:F-type H+-transporting ATPase subunit delta
MITGSLSRRYARAVLGLAKDQGNLDRVAADLRTLGGAMTGSEELTDALTNPGLRRAERKKIVDALLARIGAAQLSKTIVSMLLDRERIGSLPGIARELDAMVEAMSGRVSAEVTSARPLAKPQLDQIAAALEKLSGKQVDIVKREDPALLGGIVAKLGDVVYDGSLRTQLHALRDDLAK